MLQLSSCRSPDTRYGNSEKTGLCHSRAWDGHGETDAKLNARRVINRNKRKFSV